MNADDRATWQRVAERVPIVGPRWSGPGPADAGAAARERKGTHDELAPFPVCMTSEAHHAVMSTVGRLPAETGAKGFSPPDRLGFEIVEFDEHGSAQASGAIYSPDEVWGDERCAYWQDQPEGQVRLWAGDIHSHPYGAGRPSGKSGQGLGDLGYVEEVFAQNPWMQHFLLPIVVNPGRDAEIVPWVVARDHPQRPLRAELQVCPVEEFPERRFNPEWEREAASPPPTRRMPLDVDRLADRLGAAVTVTELRLQIQIGETALVVVVGDTFPVRGPELFVRSQDAGLRPLPVPVSWDAAAGAGERDLEARVAELCMTAADWLSRWPRKSF